MVCRIGINSFSKKLRFPLNFLKTIPLPTRLNISKTLNLPRIMKIKQICAFIDLYLYNVTEREGEGMLLS